MTEPAAPTDHATERPGGVRGRVVLLITLGIIIAVPAITILSLRMAEQHLEEPPPLDWADRASWQLIHVQGTSLERGPMSSARTNQTYFEIPSPITPEEEAAVWRCAQLMLKPLDEFRSDETGRALREIAAAHPDLFYPHYVLAIWARQPGVQEPWGPHMAKAVRLAPRCVVVPVVDGSGRPLADFAAGAMQLSMTKVVDDQIDESLVMPYLIWSDEYGRAYLPIFAGKYRMQDYRVAPNVEPTRLIGGWFTFPGQVGALPAWEVVSRES